MEIEIGKIVLEDEIEIGAIEMDIQKIYPKLEDLEIKPSGQEQIFKHPNSYGYDTIIVSPVASDTLNVIPKSEKQVFKGLFGTVNVEELTVPVEQWYAKECETWT